MAVIDVATSVTTCRSVTHENGSSLLQERHTAIFPKAPPVHPFLNATAKLQPLSRIRTKKKYCHVEAAHSIPRTSYLSHDSQVSPSFLGFRNLMVIVLIAGNLRLVIENYTKYGVLICLQCHNYQTQDIIYGVALLFIIPCHLFLAYVVELNAAYQARAMLRQGKDREGTATPGGSYIASDKEKRAFQQTWRVIAWIHGINASVCLFMTSFVVYYFIHHPLIGTLSEIHAIIVWLKTASYGLTNRDLRHAYLHPSRREEDALPQIYDKCPYPNNITLGNLIYFWWAPTLVYQPVYPRTPTIRWIFVVKRVAEIIFLGAFMWIASAQYAAPVLRNSLDKIVTLDIPSILERLMKLSTISLAIWLAGFFAFFQSFLNALAEVMRFGDREFYTDWWNSPSLGIYWRTWNKPVYQFMKRHVFSPLLARGWGSLKASIAVFTFSALLHELLVGIPTHNIIAGVAFFGMMIQIPLIALTAPLETMNGVNGKIVGNCIFWVTFTLIGQPLALLLYFFAWQAKYGSASQAESATRA
ncbi:BgTH12-07773 [Blumeria graminis f. sp. triticale]|uniref:O-acyltransferase n=3 Tax=Blumeria graminis TaxID=34373 RepID=A0A9X9QH27_BLUGR|nr:acyltransferase [Blumeria graminis f. sp. tritici 96224]CAD6506546.1 BgTH12-07773 [Blumeria graminis f. sp. triticale]VDB96400.1 Bgt-2984 [Blumeria graminis f. sp. tritici]